MGQNNDFLPKNGLKTAFLSITILDHPTSDWAGTQIFKGIANFHMCFEKCGNCCSEAAPMGTAGGDAAGEGTSGPPPQLWSRTSCPETWPIPSLVRLYQISCCVQLPHHLMFITH